MFDINILSVLILGLLSTFQMLYINRISRRGVYFGVRLPEGYTDEKLKKIMLGFRRFILLSGLFVIPLAFYFRDDVNTMFISAFIVIAAQQLSFYYFNVRMRRYKRMMSFEEDSPVKVDLELSKDRLKGKLPLYLYAIPFLIIAVTLVILLKNYDKLPDMIPTHWGVDGADAFTKRNSLNSMLFVILQIIMTLVFIIVNVSILYMKQDLRGKNEDDILNLMRVRKLWTLYCIVSATLLTFAVGLLQMYTLGMFGITNRAVNIVFIVFTLFEVLAALFIGFRYGTTGEWSKKSSAVGYSDDDKYWYLFGTLYFNREDPALFLPKRVGIGTTINFGNIKAVLLFLGFMGAFFLVMHLITR